MRSRPSSASAAKVSRRPFTSSRRTKAHRHLEPGRGGRVVAEVDVDAEGHLAVVEVGRDRVDVFDSTSPTMKPVASTSGIAANPGTPAEVGHGLGHGDHVKRSSCAIPGARLSLIGGPGHEGGRELERLVAERGEPVRLLRGDEHGVAGADLGDLLAEQRPGAPPWRMRMACSWWWLSRVGAPPAGMRK